MNPNWTLALVTLSLPTLYLVLSCTLTISVKTCMRIHLNWIKLSVLSKEESCCFEPIGEKKKSKNLSGTIIVRLNYLHDILKKLIIALVWLRSNFKCACKCTDYSWLSIHFQCKECRKNIVWPHLHYSGISCMECWAVFVKTFFRVFQGYRIVYLLWDPLLDWFVVHYPADPAQPKHSTMYVWNWARILQVSSVKRQSCSLRFWPSF